MRQPSRETRRQLFFYLNLSFKSLPLLWLCCLSCLSCIPTSLHSSIRATANTHSKNVWPVGVNRRIPRFQCGGRRRCYCIPRQLEAVAATVTQTELCVHSVLTLYAYVGLCKRARWADSVALIALSFQLFGAIMFIGPDLMLGCPNMQPFDQLTCTPGISWFEVFYFWFGVTVNVVWIIIPMILMKNIIQRSIQNN